MTLTPREANAFKLTMQVSNQSDFIPVDQFEEHLDVLSGIIKKKISDSVKKFFEKNTGTFEISSQEDAELYQKLIITMSLERVHRDLFKETYNKERYEKYKHLI